MQTAASDDQLRLAARLYYVDGLGQAEVAKFVKVSQAKISRLLALARQRGIVQISVAEYEPRNAALEQQLITHFHLHSAAVIKTVPGALTEAVRETTGYFGAAFVASLIPENSIVAIAGGRTIRELIRLLPEDSQRRPTVVQAMGNIDSQVGPVDAFELAHTMARRWSGSFVMMNTPAFAPDKRTRDSLLALEQIRSVRTRLGRAQVALIGIGTPDNSVFVERCVLSPDELARLKQRGAVGEICGRFFDRHGRECDSPWRDRVLSIELEHLRAIPQVIGVVAGADRAAAIRAAIHGGLVKSLVIDDACALALAELASATNGSNSKLNSRRRHG